MSRILIATLPAVGHVSPLLPFARELRERGHDVVVTGDWSLGRVSAVARENGLLKGAANPRGMQGYAVGR